jgi:glycosyltransferase involved in cell wall biosynthesis
MHVLVLPKWYPGPADPQLGDFLRKQAQAVALEHATTVLVAAPLVRPWPVLTPPEALHTPFREHVVYYSPSAWPRPLNKVQNFWRFWRAMQQGFAHVVARYGMPQLVHVHILLRPALFARWLRWRHGLRYVVSEQSSEYMTGRWAAKDPFFRWLCRYLMRGASAVTTVGPGLGEVLVGHRLTEHYTVVPNVVPGLDRLLPPAGKPGHFLVVADLVDATKNVSGVLRAFELARAQINNMQLDIIGSGQDMAMLQALSTSLDPAGQVRFFGRLTNAEVLEHMAQVGAVVVNSHVETFSVVTGEALALGKPVIATRCGGPQAFVNDTNGLLIPVGDTAALAQAMVRLSHMHAAYPPQQVRDSLLGDFSPAAVGRAFSNVYATVTKPDQA